jgi:diguanylate cyclase (GGDEF)-like protein
MSEDVKIVVGFVGALTQFGSIALIVTLMLTLLPAQRDVAHFRRWTGAWLAFLLGIGAIVLRYASSDLVPFNISHRSESDSIVRMLYVVYASAKILFLTQFVVGISLLVDPPRPVPRSSTAVAFALAAGTVITAVSPNLNHIMVFQSAVAVPAFVYATVMLLRRTRSRRATGPAVLTIACVSHAVLWTFYGLAFGQGAAHLPVWHPLAVVLPYNSYIDAVVQTLLAYGIVATVMERASNQVHDAHDRLLSAHEALRQATMFDPLSGALSRHAFAAGMGLAATAHTGGVAIVVDVDHLKSINDAYGHDAGDALIKHVGESLSGVLRAEDSVYRWGGDEFLVVLPGAAEEDAKHIVDRAFARSATLAYAGVALPVQASYGVAPFASRATLSDAITEADRQMYAAKGRRSVGRETPIEALAFPGA